jgi:hypothetical protein
MGAVMGAVMGAPNMRMSLTMQVWRSTVTADTFACPARPVAR